jgi:hypothetical protein
MVFASGGISAIVPAEGSIDGALHRYPTKHLKSSFMFARPKIEREPKREN